MVGGLTPGSGYNLRTQQAGSTGATGTVYDRRILVRPSL
jgi:hypothetical protein